MTVEELRALLAAIERHPELRDELRRYVLTQELLALPAAFLRQEQRLDRVESELADLREVVRALAGSSERHEEELRALRELVQRQDERLAHIEGWLERLTALSERHEQWLARHDERFEQLTSLLAKQDERLAHLERLAQQHAEWLARHDERFEQLAALAQQHAAWLARHDERFEQLAALAQKHEEWLARHDERFEQLAASAQRHEEWLERLTRLSEQHEEELRALRSLVTKHDDDLTQLRQTVGSLSEAVGTLIEADAVDALLDLLEAKGITAEEVPTSIAVNGELDVVAPVVDPSGRRYWVVVEVKLKLHPRDIRNWHRKLQSSTFRERLAQFGIQPPFVAYIYGQRIYRPVLETARQLGLGVLARRGEYVPPAGFVE